MGFCNVKVLIEGDSGVKNLPTNINFKRGFTQIGNSAMCPSTFNIDVSGIQDSSIDGYAQMSAAELLAAKQAVATNYTITSSELTLFCSSMRITEFSSHMAGFGVCEQSLKEIAAVLAEGIAIPSQI